MSGRQPTALGGAIFAGLFTKGIEQAGYKVLGHLEHGDYGVRTALLNYPGLDVRIGLHNWKPEDFRGKVDFMYTNPPCAVWSNMRSHTTVKWDKDPRLSCVTSLVDAGLIIRPRAWCWESVTAAWTQGKSFVIEQAHRWTDVGYQATILLQDNQYLGVPQRRQRMFLIAHEHPLVWPPFTKPVTVGEVLKRTKPRKGDAPIKPLSETWKQLWERSAAHRGRLRTSWDLADTEFRAGGGAPLNTTLRLDPSKPAPVMLASFMRLHPTEPRMLNWREWLAMCGLPPDWQTAERGFDAATRELARAVMPPVGQWLGTAVKQGFAKRKVTKHVEARLVDFRKPDEPVEELLWRGGYHPTLLAPTRSPLIPPEGKPPKVLKPRAEGHSRPGSGRRMRELLQAGRSTDEVLATIRAEFPQSKATSADVSWNRRRLRLQGV